MSTVPDFAVTGGSSAIKGISAARPQSFNSAITRSEGRPVVRSPENLQLHPALVNLEFIDVAEQLDEAARSKDRSAAEPILITTNGTILAGFGHWRLALLEGRHEVHCIEYQLSENDSLQSMLSHNQTQRGWNAFLRIRLALTLEPYFQQTALENMRAGGKYKGWANLPEAEHMEVRQQIADAAGVGTRNVSNVKTILRRAHPRLIAALLSGTLSINGAMQFCTLPKAEQLEQFIRQSEDRETNKVIRRSVTRSKKDKISPDIAAVLDALQRQDPPAAAPPGVGAAPRRPTRNRALQWARTVADRRRDLALLASTGSGLVATGDRQDLGLSLLPAAPRPGGDRARGGRVGRNDGRPG